jgi:hypothetical protein
MMNLVCMSTKTSILGQCFIEKKFSVCFINEKLSLPDCHTISGKVMNLHICGEKTSIMVRILGSNSFPRVLNRKL